MLMLIIFSHMNGFSLGNHFRPGHMLNGLPGHMLNGGGLSQHIRCYDRTRRCFPQRMLPPPLDRLLQRGLHKQHIFPRNFQERSSTPICSLGQLLAIRHMQIRASVAFVAIPITPLECRTCTPGLIQRCEQLGLPLKDLGQQMLLLQVRRMIFLFFAHETQRHNHPLSECRATPREWLAVP